MNGKRVIVWSILIVTIISIAMLVTNPEPVGGRAIRGGNGVLVVRLYGPVQETGSSPFGGGAITPHLVRSHLDAAEASPGVRAVVLRISTPGGSTAASQEIYNMIRRFPKPIVISMGDQATSGGYYISAAADAIVANPGTLTGSIGVITSVTRLGGLYEKLGIEVEIVKSGKHKDMFQREITEEERRLLQELNDAAWEQFVHDVAQGREMDVTNVQNLATGEVFIGSQALELGLIDRLGDLHEAVNLAAELAVITDPVIVEPRSPSLWQQLLGAAVTLMHTLRGPSVLDPLELIESLEGIPPIRY